MTESADRAARSLPAFATPPRVLLVVSPYYQTIAGMLVAGAEKLLAEAGAAVERVDAPGALEIPTAVRLAAETGRFDGYVAIGCVIRGETSHYDIVAGESARGLMTLGVGRGLSIGNAILTVDAEAQALARANPDGQDKGGDAALACLHLIALTRKFGGASPRLKPGDEPILLA